MLRSDVWLRALAVVGVLVSPACKRDLARATSGAIGCPREAIEIADVSVGWSQMSWRASCRGLSFYCSGETDPTCAPDLLDPPAMTSDTPAPPTTAAPNDDAAGHQPLPANPAPEPRAPAPEGDVPDEATPETNLHSAHRGRHVGHRLW